jgi:5-methylcytosine-specific restriction endonuclease McrA
MTRRAAARHRLRALSKSFLTVLRRDPCAYCGAVSGTVDHIEPTIGGGPDEWANLTGACQSCNARKHTASLLQFMLAD